MIVFVCMLWGLCIRGVVTNGGEEISIVELICWAAHGFKRAVGDCWLGDRCVIYWMCIHLVRPWLASRSTDHPSKATDHISLSSGPQIPCMFSMHECSIICHSISLGLNTLQIEMSDLFVYHYCNRYTTSEEELTRWQPFPAKLPLQWKITCIFLIASSLLRCK